MRILLNKHEKKQKKIKQNKRLAKKLYTIYKCANQISFLFNYPQCNFDPTNAPKPHPY